MIRIAICDDDKNVTEKIQSFIMARNENVESELGISCYQSGEEFLQAVEEGAQFHIVFMDIEMDKVNGIEVGYILRNRSSCDDVIMIYISSHNSYVEELLDVGSIRFIRKPIEEEKLEYAFRRALNQAQGYKDIIHRGKVFHFKVGAVKYSVKADEIAYMKAIKQEVEVYVFDRLEKKISRLERFYGNLASTLKQLPPGQFIHCERAHIINLDLVCQFTSDIFTLMDQQKTEVPIGRTYAQKAKESYMNRRRNRYA